jgi:ribonuclease HI
MSFYVVKSGTKPGIYHSWADCKLQIDGFPNPQFRKFQDYTDACHYLNNTGTNEGYNILQPKPTLPSFYVTTYNKTHDYHPEHWIMMNGAYYIFPYGDYQQYSGKSGIAIYFNTHIQNIGEYYTNKLTSHQCTLIAMFYCLQIIHKYIDVLEKAAGTTQPIVNIVSNCKYSTNCLATWITKWTANDWRTCDNQPVKHKNILEKCCIYLTKLKCKLQFIHIPRIPLSPLPTATSTTDPIITQLTIGNHNAESIAYHKYILTKT